MSLQTEVRFTGELNALDRKRVEVCDSLLKNPSRLSVLRRTGLLESGSEEALDRLAAFAGKLLDVPLTIVSLVSDERQIFTGAYGLPPPFDQKREISVDGSICRFTLNGEPIIVEDADLDPFLKHHPTTKPWGIVAFAAIPMVSPDGHVLGAFCAVDSKPRPWSERDLYVMRELTASVMTEINLRMQILELNAERELRERFVAALSHDLRTPIASSKMNAQLVQRKAEVPSLVREVSGRIVSSLDRAHRMIVNLLDANRLRAGQELPLNVAACDLRQLLKGTVTEFEGVYGERFEAMVELPDANVYVDANEIKRVIENLVGNAVKYGSPLTMVKIRVGSKGEGQFQIAVTNYGNPMPEPEQSQIFIAYCRGKSPQVKSQPGWGIGLMLVRAIVAAHGGRVHLTSNQNDGTTFYVDLPLDCRKPKPK